LTIIAISVAQRGAARIRKEKIRSIKDSALGNSPFPLFGKKKGYPPVFNLKRGRRNSDSVKV
jgi:hypothetical protein